MTAFCLPCLRVSPISLLNILPLYLFHLEVGSRMVESRTDRFLGLYMFVYYLVWGCSCYLLGFFFFFFFFVNDGMRKVEMYSISCME